MSKSVGFFNFSIRKILYKDQSFIDKARIRLLYYGLAFLFFLQGGLLINAYVQHQFMQTLSGTIFLIVIAILFKLLTYRPRWSVISHMLLIVSTTINLLTVFVILQNVDIITVLGIVLIVIFSFYMGGQRWGLIYSLVNILPVLLFLVLVYDNNYIINIKPEKLEQSTIIISVFANFILIIFIQSHFYSAFLKKTVQLKQTSDEQSQLNLKLEIAINKAEKSSEAKSEFLSTMSHEIRTPLNAVIGMSNLLIMGSPRPDQKENLDILKFSANNLLAIVNDVLDFNKIESGRVVFEKTRFNLVDLMHSICGGQMINAKEKGLIFKLDIDSAFNKKILFGDPTRITQIIFNLVGNAIKFTAQGNILVKIKCLEDRHNTITVNFSVKDTGIGIEKQNLDMIFEPFAQESVTTTRQYGGTGLGLAIVKRLLELQGRQMHVVSEIGVGSEFSFSMEFPVSTETYVERKEQQSSFQNHDSLGALSVLIAEDNPVNVMLMKKLFSKWNIIPSIAENGERAIELVQYGNFDIILMDLQMPVLNGFDAAIEIRKMADPKKANIPIIALTASALFDIKDKVYSAGMNAYISKPFKPDELLETIRGLAIDYSIMTVSE